MTVAAATGRPVPGWGWSSYSAIHRSTWCRCAARGGMPAHQAYQARMSAKYARRGGPMVAAAGAPPEDPSQQQGSIFGAQP